MNDDILEAAKSSIPANYVTQASQTRCSLGKQFKELLEKKHCPETGWGDAAIELLLKEISLMDSNNFPHNIGVGERESRIYSGLVAKRHFEFGHGIGRSGELTEPQPKAAGSSLLYHLTNSMVLHIVKVAGIRSALACLVVPVATGMSLVLCLLAVRKQRPHARYVIWPRIDQKSCFKCITAAGFEPLVIENIYEGDELRTNVTEIEKVINEVSQQTVAAVLTTTSCFAPRGIDKLEEVSILCKDYAIPHIINNAYGLQSSKCTHHIEQASRVGRVDAFVQSTDKNFMVPVGGAVIAGFNKEFIDSVSKIYPGRASSSPIVDLFITLLSMGVTGYKRLLKERKDTKVYLEEQLGQLAEKFDLKVLVTKNNPISIAMTLPAGSSSVTELGSMLFLRGVSGTRVLSGKETKVINGHTFQGWGTHTNSCHCPYLTAAASIGMTRVEVDTFIKRLEKCLQKFIAKERHVITKNINSHSISNGCEDERAIEITDHVTE